MLQTMADGLKLSNLFFVLKCNAPENVFVASFLPQVRHGNPELVQKTTVNVGNCLLSWNYSGTKPVQKLDKLLAHSTK
jgi:hypothetical protein